MFLLLRHSFASDGVVNMHGNIGLSNDISILNIDYLHIYYLHSYFADHYY